MDESRYRDKSYLVTYDLTTDIFDGFGVEVIDIIPIRSVYMLYTDKGVKILKRINYPLDELKFINSVVNSIKKDGYDFVVPFMETPNGQYYVKQGEGIYVMLDMIEGREVDFRNVFDIQSAAKALCMLHKSTRGVSDILDTRNNLYKWVDTFKRRIDDLYKFKEIAELHEIKSSFDDIYLSYFDSYFDEARESVKALEDSSYIKLCDEAKENTNICHHDLAYHNILMDSENNIHFVDFDYCIADIRLHDIANLIVKSIKHYRWDIDKALLIIQNYSEIDEITKEELEVLYGFLLFPHDFYEVSRQYYMKTKKWDESDFSSKIGRKAGYYEDRKEFLKNFRLKLI
jgi:CotS family spore coat protein